MKSCQPGQKARLIQYGLYPLLLAVMLGYAAFELQQPAGEFGSHYGIYLAALVGVMLVAETLHPLRAEWRMTCASFFRRDLPFMAIGALTLGAANFAAGWFVLHFGVERGVSHAGLPLVPAVFLAVAIPDFIWYWVHRFSHEGRGPVGRWFWKMHVAHHLPQQVYLFMHAVAHPFNTVIVRLILTLPLFYLGFSTEALFVANLFVGLQGFVSHFNVDIRVGWLNYVLVGTELHRYHHSTDPKEGKNYAAVVSLWDLLFGTFYYRPGENPQKLGVQQPDHYPRDTELLKVLTYPLVSNRRGAGHVATE
jgi:sterol desaturase/sphingolipid hydroxylase (fatty acid hydroxylase superfamily)